METKIMWEILQINGEWEEFFLQAEVRERLTVI